MIEIWMENHLVSDSNYNIVNIQSLYFFYKERRIMLGVTISICNMTPLFTVGIEQDNYNW